MREKISFFPRNSKNGAIVPWTVLAIAFGLVTALFVADLIVSRSKEEKIYEKNANNAIALTEGAVSQIFQKTDYFLRALVSEYAKDMDRAKQFLEEKDLQDYGAMQKIPSADLETELIIKNPGNIISDIDSADSFVKLEELVNLDLKARASESKDWQAESLRLVDAAGNVVFMTGIANSSTGVNVKERDYFIQQEKSKNNEVQVLSPFKSQISGKWLIPVTRKFINKDGKFNGIALIFIRADFIKDLISTVDIGEFSSLSIIDNTGGIIARSPSLPIEQDVEFKSNDLYKKLNSGINEGKVLTNSAIDNEEYTVKYKKLLGSPLIIIAALHDTDMFTHWYKKLAIYSISWLFIVFMLGSLWKISGHNKVSMRDIQDKEFLFNKTVNLINKKRLAEETALLKSNLIINSIESSVSENIHDRSESEWEKWYEGLVDKIWHLKNISVKCKLLLNVIEGESLSDGGKTDVGMFFEKTSINCKTIASIKSLEFQSTSSGMHNAKYFIDSKPVEYIITNLMTNALKFTKSGYVNVSCILHEEEDKKFVKFTVSNSGYGINSEKREKMKSALSWGKDRSESNDFGFMGLVLIGAMINFINGTIEIEGGDNSFISIVAKIPVN